MRALCVVYRYILLAYENMVHLQTVALFQSSNTHILTYLGCTRGIGDTELEYLHAVVFTITDDHTTVGRDGHRFDAFHLTVAGAPCAE